MKKALYQHLKPETQAWLRRIDSDRELEPWHERLLIQAGEQWDRKEAARKRILIEGSVVSNRHGEKVAHPSVKVERDSATLFARLLREIRLDHQPAEARLPRQNDEAADV